MNKLLTTIALLCLTAPAYATQQIITMTSPSFSTPITITSYSQNATAPANKGNAAATATAVCGQVAVTKLIDTNSPILLQEVLSGTPIKQILITFAQQSGDNNPFTYYTVLLQNVTMLSITQSDSIESIIREQVAFTATRFKFTFFGQNPDGSSAPGVAFGFDCGTQTQTLL